MAVAWSGFLLSPACPHSSPESHQEPQPLASPPSPLGLKTCPCTICWVRISCVLSQTPGPFPPLRPSPGVQCGQLMLKLCQPHLKVSPSPLLPCLQLSHWTPHPAGLSWASQLLPRASPGPALPGMHMGAPRLRVGLAQCPELPWAGKQEGNRC